jgi:hypothetical protein
MPNLDLPFLDRSYRKLCSLEQLQVWCAVCPVIVHPNDPGKRSATETLLLVLLRKKMKPRRLKKGREQSRRRISKLANSVLLVPSASQVEDLAGQLFAETKFGKATPSHRDLYSVFYLLWLLVRLEATMANSGEEPSLNVAIAMTIAAAKSAGRLLKKEPEGEPYRRLKRKGAQLLYQSRSELRAVWSHYNRVLHLIAGAVCAGISARQSGIEGRVAIDELDTFLGASLYFQKFLLRFRRGSRPLVNLRLLWQLPNVRGISEFEIEHEPFTAVEQLVLDTVYKKTHSTLN